MIINNNIPALNTHRQMGINQNAMQNSMEKLSSGLRINRAGDDAAGLSISEKMRAQINGLDQASRNAQDGISLIQTAEGGLDETHSILQRMRELATQAANDTNESVDRDALQNEITQLASEIDRIGENTEFNEKKLLNGDLSTDLDNVGASLINENGIANISVSGAKADTYTLEVNAAADEITLSNVAGDSVTKSVTAPTGFDTLDVSFGELGITVTVNAQLSEIDGTNTFDVTSDDNINLQIGANEGQRMNISISDMTTTGLNLDANALDVSDHDAAGNAITAINDAIQTVSNQRSELGAFQNRLEHTISNLDNSSENLSAAESRIRDVDMAAEMMEMTRTNILSQASQSMLAQANQQPQAVLQLLG